MVHVLCARFPRYMQTYQVDADYPPPEQTAESPLAKSPTFADLTEKLVINKEAMGNKKKTQKKRKTVFVPVKQHIKLLKIFDWSTHKWNKTLMKTKLYS